VLEGPPEVTGDAMIAAMDDAGVDAAILVSPLTIYGFDPSYAIEVHAQHPDRFALICPFDRRAPDLSDWIAAWAERPGVVGARVLIDYDPPDSVDDPGLNRIFAEAAAHGLPLSVHAAGYLPLVADLADRHPNTQVVLDHLGLLQPFVPPVPPEPFADLPNVLALARRDNVVIKISGAGTLSHHPFPYDDIWPPIMEIVDAYGLDRCLWGTDWTRAVRHLTYEEGVRAFTETDHFSETERAALMAGNLIRVFGWRPTKGRYGRRA